MKALCLCHFLAKSIEASVYRFWELFGSIWVLRSVPKAMRFFLRIRSAAPRSKRVILTLSRGIITLVKVFRETLGSILLIIWVILIWFLIALIIVIIVNKFLQIKLVYLFHFKGFSVGHSEIVTILNHLDVIHQTQKLPVIFIIFEWSNWYAIRKLCSEWKHSVINNYHIFHFSISENSQVLYVNIVRCLDAMISVESMLN